MGSLICTRIRPVITTIHIRCHVYEGESACSSTDRAAKGPSVWPARITLFEWYERGRSFWRIEGFESKARWWRASDPRSSHLLALGRADPQLYVTHQTQHRRCGVAWKTRRLQPDGTLTDLHVQPR